MVHVSFFGEEKICLCTDTFHFLMVGDYNMSSVFFWVAGVPKPGTFHFSKNSLVIQSVDSRAARAGENRVVNKSNLARVLKTLKESGE